jgi:Peptidase family M28
MTRFIVALSALLPAVLLGQSGPPWFGLAIPPGLADPHKAVVNVAAATPVRPRVPSGEGPYRDLQGIRIRKDVDAIVGFSKKSRAEGNKVWGRVTGFPSAVATHSWVAEQFTAAGLTGVAVQTYDASAPMWWATSWDARLVGDEAFGAGSRDVVLHSAIPTSGSQLDAPLTAPLVHVGAITAALPAVDVKGKVAVQHLKPASGAYSERGRTTERARELAKRGALAVLNVIEQTGNMHVRDFANCGVPCFNLGGADGAFVEAAIERAARAGRPPVRVRLTLQAESLSGLQGQNTIGLVAGDSDENIIVNAHVDGWFDAAGDNADGLAVLVAMARHFGRPDNRPERTLVFVASGGHHSTGLNGPSNLVRMNPALASKTTLVLNLEHVAQFAIQSRTWTVDSDEQSMSFGISNEAPFLVEVARRGVERYGFNLEPSFSANVPGDLGGYQPLGVPRVQAIHSGPMYHTSGDVAETISAPGLERAARFFTYFVNEVARAKRSDFDPGK